MNRKGFEGIVPRSLDQIDSGEFHQLLKRPAPPAEYNSSHHGLAMTQEVETTGSESDEAFEAWLKGPRSGQGWLEKLPAKSTMVVARINIREQRGKRKGKKFAMRIPWSDPRKAILLGSMDELEIRKSGIKAAW